MEWKITVHENYIEIVTDGIADSESSMRMADAIKNTMRSNRVTRALIDHSHLENVSGNTIEIYDRPGMFKIIGGIFRIKIAEIIKPEHREHFQFFETVCKNQGFQFSIFQDRGQALEWLLL